MKKKLQLAVMLLSMLLISNSSSSQVITQTLSYTGSLQTFTIPSCVSTVTITAYGAQGALGGGAPSGALGGNAGLGGMVQGTYTVVAGNIFNVYVGGVASGTLGGFNGGGNGGLNAGGGGGASDIRIGTISLSSRILVAGGGGGGGGASCPSPTISGGNGGNSGSNGFNGTNSIAGGGGFGGSGTIGGAAGIGCSFASGTVGINGVSGVGGNGGNGLSLCGNTLNNYNSGGGGGGGYNGGGAGGGGSAGTTSCTLNDSGAGGGGAGGSNYFNAAVTNTAVTNGVRSGNGLVILSYSINPTPTISVNSGSLCSGTSFTVVPTGATSYTYQGGSSVVNPTAYTTYTVIGSTGGCVSNVVTSSVTVNALPSISVNSGSICTGKSFTMVPSGAATYTFSSGNAVVTPTLNATYNVVGTSSLGCVSSNTAISTVTVNGLPTVTVNSGVICIGQSFTMIPSGAIAYTYSNGTDLVTPTSNANYTVIGTDANGCENTTVSSVTVNTLPSVTVNSGAICAGQSFTMTPSGASTYTYSNGTDVVTPTANDSYTVTGTDANGCENTAVSSVTVNTLPSVTVNSGAICAGQSFTIVPSGANTYAYSNGTDIITPTSDATYTVIGTDANGCENTAVSSVTVNTLPSVTINSGAICSGKSFTMTPSGASTYIYSNGSAVTTPTANNSYTVTGTDANGCSNTAVSSVTVNALPVLTAVTNHTLICAGETATLSVSGATTYTWSTTANTTTVAVSPTVQTTYTVNGTDANGCSNNTTVTLDVSACTGIATLSNDASINVYPNPNNGLFVIELTSDSKVTVMNALGQVVIAETFEAGKHTVNINNEATGVYFVKVMTNNKQQIIKVIKE